MSGSVDSLVCPRCGQEMPHSDAATSFMECTRCGLSFDASLKARTERLSRKSLDPRGVAPLAVEPPAGPDAPVLQKPARLSLTWSRPTLWPILGVAISLAVLGVLKYENHSQRSKLERRVEAAMRSLDDLHGSQADPAAGTPGQSSCEELTALAASPPTCSTSEITAAVGEVIGRARDAMTASKATGQAREAVCAEGMADIYEARARAGC